MGVLTNERFARQFLPSLTWSGKRCRDVIADSGGKDKKFNKRLISDNKFDLRTRLRLQIPITLPQGEGGGIAARYVYLLATQEVWNGAQPHTIESSFSF